MIKQILFTLGILFTLALTGCAINSTRPVHETVCKSITNTANEIYKYKDVLTKYQIDQVTKDLLQISFTCGVSDSTPDTIESLKVLQDLEQLEQKLVRLYGKR